MKKYKLIIILGLLTLGSCGGGGIGGVNTDYKSRKCRSLCEQTYNPQSDDQQERINHSKCYLNCVNN